MAPHGVQNKLKISTPMQTQTFHRICLKLMESFSTAPLMELVRMGSTPMSMAMRFGDAKAMRLAHASLEISFLTKLLATLTSALKKQIVPL